MGQHFDDLFAIAAAFLEVRRHPGQVVVELVAAGEERLQVDEVLQSAFGMQVVQKGVVAGRRARGDQILEEGDLHMGVVEHHVRVPGEGGLTFDEEGISRLPPLVLLFEGDGQGDVGGAEADTDQVVNTHVNPRGCRDYREKRGAGLGVEPG